MGCICKPIPLVQTKVPTNQKQNLQVYQINQSNQNIENFETNKTQIKQTNNNNIINNEENNFTQNNITNTNNNIPKLPKYDPNLLLSTNSSVSNASSEQHEILINGKRNIQYSLKHGDLDNSGLINYLQDEDKYANVNNVPISESFSYFNKNNENKIDILNNKSGTFVGSSNLKIPVMQSQASKSSQYYCNKGNKINISLSGSGTGSGVYIYYPNKDNTPIPDLDNIDEKIQDQI